jgi:hypothetical protein
MSEADQLRRFRQNNKKEENSHVNNPTIDASIYPFALFGADGEPSEYGRQLTETFHEVLDRRVREIIEQLNTYIDEEVHPVVEGEVDDLRKLMIIAVGELGGADARESFLKKIAALARTGALSAAAGDWAQAGTTAKARDTTPASETLRPNSRLAKYEEFEGDEAEAALEVFAEVTGRLTKDQREQMKVLTEDVEFDGDVEGLRERLTVIADNAFPPVNPYVDAISRTVRH